jgi:orotate phosphoribosyltransferase
MNYHTLTTEAEQVAAYLLETGAVELRPTEPFTWASGWKSPIYCDNRRTLSFPKVRSFIAKALAQKVRKNFNMVEAIAGVATAGIPWATLVADELDLPLLYIRSSPKGHGKENLIEGKIELDQRVVVIEDLISTGGSSLKAAQAITDAEMTPLGMVALFTYGFQIAVDNFTQANLPLHTLSNYEELLKLAIKTDLIDQTQLVALSTWRENPAIWGV